MKKIIFTYLLLCAGFILAQRTVFAPVHSSICVAETTSFNPSHAIFRGMSSTFRQEKFRPVTFWFRKKPIYFVIYNIGTNERLRTC